MAEPSRALLRKKARLPGQFTIADTGEQVNLLDKHEGNLIDTLVIGDYTLAAYAITAGMQFDWFTGCSTKSKAFTNFKVDKKVPAGWYIAVTKLGIHFRPFAGNVVSRHDDILKVAENSVANLLKIENSKREEPPLFWQSGFGWAGMTTETNRSYISAGVPSPAAIPQIKVPFSLVPGNDLEGYIAFPQNVLPDSVGGAGHGYVFPTLASPVMATIVIHGIIMKSGVKA